MRRWELCSIISCGRLSDAIRRCVKPPFWIGFEGQCIREVSAKAKARRGQSYNVCITREVPLEFGAENAIWPLFFKGLAQLVDFLGRAYAHSGFRHRGRPGKNAPRSQLTSAPMANPAPMADEKARLYGNGRELEAACVPRGKLRTAHVKSPATLRSGRGATTWVLSIALPGY